MDMKNIEKLYGRNAIQLILGNKQETNLPIGASKLGGKPDLPTDFIWPTFGQTQTIAPQKTWKNWFKPATAKTRTVENPLTFMLQVNCKDLAPYDIENELPHTGILSFFYDLDSMPWGYDPAHKGCAKVYHFEEDHLLSTPIDDMTGHLIGELPISFGSRMDIPDYDEFATTPIDIADKNDYTTMDSEEYCEYRTSLDIVEGHSHKLLGYADIIQQSMLEECELCVNGQTHEHKKKMTPSQREALAKNSQQWKLLLQLDTIDEGDFPVMFGDCGHIYFYIRKNDLQDKRFDDCWLVLQCY